MWTATGCLPEWHADLMERDMHLLFGDCHIRGGTLPHKVNWRQRKMGLIKRGEGSILHVGHKGIHI
jgi:hypothetical protein